MFIRTQTPDNGPSIALIPLPPGFTLKQYLSLQSSLVSLSLASAIAFGIIVWDYFYLLRNEYEYYQAVKRKEWRTLSPYLFMILRCSGVVSILAATCITSFQSDSCQFGISISQGSAAIVVATSGIGFGYRVRDVWRSKAKLATILMSVAYIIMVGSWVVVATQFRATNGPPTYLGSNCRIMPFASWMFISYASSVLFNCIALALMLLKLFEKRERPSKVICLAYWESLLNIAITTTASIVVLGVQLLPSERELWKQTIMPFSTLITATMGARIFLTIGLSRSNSSETHKNILGNAERKPAADFRIQVKTDRVAYVVETALPPLLPEIRSEIAPSPDTSLPPRKFKALPPTPSVSPAGPRPLPKPPRTLHESPCTRKIRSCKDVKPIPISYVLHKNEYTTFPSPPVTPRLLPSAIPAEPRASSTVSRFSSFTPNIPGRHRRDNSKSIGI